MVLHLAEQLEVPLRERNRLLLAAGLRARLLRSARSSELGPIKDALDQLLEGHEPFPAIVVDRALERRRRQRARSPMLTAGVAPSTCSSRRSTRSGSTLHPEGMAPRIANLGEWRAHLLRDLARQVASRPATTQLHALLRRAAGATPGPSGEPGAARGLRPARMHSTAADVPEHPHDVRHRRST